MFLVFVRWQGVKSAHGHRPGLFPITQIFPHLALPQRFEYLVCISFIATLAGVLGAVLGSEVLSIQRALRQPSLRARRYCYQVPSYPAASHRTAPSFRTSFACDPFEVDVALALRSLEVLRPRDDKELVLLTIPLYPPDHGLAPVALCPLFLQVCGNSSDFDIHFTSFFLLKRVSCSRSVAAHGALVV
jgi:hypothetical protein